jgi:hypothetical protein
MKKEPGTAGHFLKTWHIMPTSNSHAVPSFFARFLYRMKDKGALSANKVANDSKPTTTLSVSAQTERVKSPLFTFRPPYTPWESWGDQVVEIGQKRPLEKKLEQGFFLMLLCFLAL